jgi:predicted  nucleic acid-binding Zn ribbon protein
LRKDLDAVASRLEAWINVLRHRYEKLFQRQAKWQQLHDRLDKIEAKIDSVIMKEEAEEDKRDISRSGKKLVDKIEAKIDSVIMKEVEDLQDISLAGEKLRSSPVAQQRPSGGASEENKTD